MAVQAGPLRSDDYAGQYHVHPHSDERRPVPGYLSPATAHLQTEGHDRRVMAVGAPLRRSTALHLQTGLTFIHVLASSLQNTAEYNTTQHNTVRVLLSSQNVTNVRPC